LGVMQTHFANDRDRQLKVVSKRLSALCVCVWRCWDPWRRLRFHPDL
jgi:hypothetical protein